MRDLRIVARDSDRDYSVGSVLMSLIERNAPSLQSLGGLKYSECYGWGGAMSRCSCKSRSTCAHVQMCVVQG